MLSDPIQRVHHLLDEHCFRHRSQLAVVFAAVGDSLLQLTRIPWHPRQSKPGIHKGLTGLCLKHPAPHTNPPARPTAHASNTDTDSNVSPAAQRKRRFLGSPPLAGIPSGCQSTLPPRPHAQTSHLDHGLPVRGFVGGGDEQPAGRSPRLVPERGVEELLRAAACLCTQEGRQAQGLGGWDPGFRSQPGGPRRCWGRSRVDGVCALPCPALAVQRHFEPVLVQGLDSVRSCCG